MRLSRNIRFKILQYIFIDSSTLLFNKFYWQKLKCLVALCMMTFIYRAVRKTFDIRVYRAKEKLTNIFFPTQYNKYIILLESLLLCKITLLITD